MNIINKRWIGLAEVLPQEGNQDLSQNSGAYVPVVGDAIDERAFFELVQNELQLIEFKLVRLQDLELLETRIKKHSLPDPLAAAINAISSENLLAYGTFQAFKL